MSEDSFITKLRRSNLFDPQKKLLSEMYDSITKWSGNYTSGNTVLPNTMVNVDGWLMVSNKETSTFAGPTAVGDPFDVYEPDNLTDTSTTAKQILFGTRYSFPYGAWVSSYRVYVTAGNHYHVYFIKDPDGYNEITQLIDFIADTTGWQEYTMEPFVVPTGTVFEIVVRTDEPNVTPVNFDGVWDYQKPNNASIPAASTIAHANRAPESLRVDKFDDSMTDRSTELSGMSIGDTIQSENILWSIQDIVDEGSYFDFTVSPALQEDFTGLGTFTFNTTEPTPIEYSYETDKWVGNDSVQGFFVVDGAHSSAELNENAYGVDIQVQKGILSEDWDFVSKSAL